MKAVERHPFFEMKLETRLVGRRLLYFPRVGSTNDVAKELARGGAQEGTVVIAEEQSEGRGRHGRRWHAPAGSSLLCSVLLYPRAEELPGLTMAAGLSVAQTLRASLGLPATIKWPNDVRVHGRKIAGVLLEATFEGERLLFAVVGIGINVNTREADFPEELSEQATSASMELCHSVPRAPLLKAVLEEFDSRYLALRRGESLREEWCRCLDTLGEWVRVVNGQGEVVEQGLACDADEHGRLLLRRADGTLALVAAGEVRIRY